MLCPEVQNFQTNLRHRVTEKNGRIGDSNYKSELRTSITDLGVVTGVVVSVPGTGCDNLRNIINVLQEDTEFYSVSDFSPAVLFNKEFLHNFVQSGSLFMVNKHKNTQCGYVEECIYLSNKNLNLTLNSRVSALDELSQKRYSTKDCLHHYQLNLETIFQKVTNKLSAELTEALCDVRMNVMVTWSHPDTGVCPSSIASYLCDYGFQVQEECCKVLSEEVDRTRVPDDDDYDTNNFYDEIATWLGEVAMGIEPRLGSESDHDSDMEASIPISTVKGNGMFSSRTMLHLSNQCSSIFSCSTTIPWICVTFLADERRSSFEGKQFLGIIDNRTTLIIKRNGTWYLKKAKSIDYSFCKKSKYN